MALHTHWKIALNKYVFPLDKNAGRSKGSDEGNQK